MNQKIISLALALVMLLGVGSVSAFDEGYDPYDSAWTDNLAWPYDPNWRGNVALNHGMVPEEVLAEPVYEPGIDSVVTRTYPQGKLKAVLLAFDDSGSPYSIDQDRTIIRALNQRGLKGTFYILTKGFDPTASANSAWGSAYPKTYDGFKAGFKDFFVGHETQGHCITGRSVENLNPEKFTAEMAQIQRRVEEMTGKEVAGMSYHYNDSTGDPVEERITDEQKTIVLKDLGFRYARRSVKDLTQNTKRNYNPPLSFFDWQYDHYMDKQIEENMTISYPRYFTMDPDNKMKVMVCFTHGPDMVGLSWQDTDASRAKTQRFYDFADLLAQYKDVFWNPGTLEYVDYMNASRQLEIKYVGTGDVSVYNPSQVISCWVVAAGEAMSIAPGQTVIIPNPNQIAYQPQGALASFTADAALTDNVLTDIGTSTLSLGGSSTVSQDNVGTLQLVQTKATKDTDYIGLSDPWLITPSKMTMVDIAYRVKADHYSDQTPLTAMAFSLPTVGLVGNAKLSTTPVVPTAEKEEMTRSLRIAIDNNAKTVYYSENSGAFQRVSYPYDISYLRHLRIYPTAYPASGDITEGTAPLAAPITWSIDSIQIYQPSKQDLLKISALKLEAVTQGGLAYTLDTQNTAGKVDFSVSARNYGLGQQNFTIITALYEDNNGALKLTEMKTKAFTDVQPMFYANFTDNFAVEGMEKDYVVKTFIWENQQTLFPYDCILRTKAQILSTPTQ